MKIDVLSTKIPAKVFEEIPLVIQKFSINSPLRLAHFLAQCAHESGNFKFVIENLNYKEDRLLLIFKSDFDKNKDRVLTDSEKKKAKELIGSPEKIANFVYANQNGNGNEASGDGWKFMGRGYIQLTGRDNYSQLDKLVEEDILSNPDLVATKYPLMSAAFFFEKNNLWKLCDGGADKEDVIALTKRINGGTHGLEDRLAKFSLFNSLLS
jgi:putative chitinase